MGSNLTLLAGVGAQPHCHLQHCFDVVESSSRLGELAVALAALTFLAGRAEWST